jgi:hypothetical protein
MRFEGGFYDKLFQTARKLLILKWRDGRVVEGARLENDSGELHQIVPKHFFAQSIQRLPATEYFSM